MFYLRHYAIVALAIACLSSDAEAKHRHHRQHHGVENSALVHSINAKLARWVRPTGKCGFGSVEKLATYYNSGRRTANGEIFHPGGMTAAHRTLPFGTQLRVTNPHTGRNVRLRINDRGPFTNANIDLAYGAARAIGMQTSIYVCIEGI